MEKQSFDRIRILWIEDRPGEDGTTPNKLPEIFEPYFEIPYKNDSGALSFDSLATFDKLKAFWVDGNTDLFPVEIVTVDYDMSKRWSHAQRKGIMDDNHISDSGRAIPWVRNYESVSSQSQRARDHDSPKKAVDFEGLIGALIYASLASSHPTGFLPATYQEGKMPPVVTDIERIMESLFGINMEFKGECRSWEKMLPAAVKHLRGRIIDLYKRKEIVISITDLMALANEKAETLHERLTIRSPYATRRLPIHGLFCDVPKENRIQEAQSWADGLLKYLQVDHAELEKAKEFLEKLWAAYMNDDLVDDRERLSLLESKVLSGKASREELLEHTKLFKTFDVVIDKSGKKNCTSESCIELRWGEYSNTVRRWTALLMIFRLLGRLVKIRNEVIESIQNTLTTKINCNIDPAFFLADFYYGMFAVAKNPIVFPWHGGENLDTSHGWAKALKRLEPPLNLNDVFAGKGWDGPKGPCGIKSTERLVLQGVALAEYPEIERADWEAYSYAKSFLYGN